MTLRVASMPTSVWFYRDVLGMEVIYGNENGYFSSLRTKDGKDPILNLEQGNPATQWGRLIFHVSDVDMGLPQRNKSRVAVRASKHYCRTGLPLCAL